ncbi:MAG: glycosyltransferase family 2 protein [Roseburia inulinivorans]
MDKILSIVVPAYNVEKYLDRCLTSFEIDSILEKIEVLVVNDGSKDHTADIAQKYCDKYPETYFLYNKENGGHGSGINYGIRYATGKYFKIVDGDDWLNKQELSAFVEMLGRIDTDIVATDFVCVQNQTDKVLQKKYCTLKKEQYGKIADITKGEVRNVIKMHAMTIRTAILKQNSIKIDEHCYYVDCEYITYPIPYVRSIYFYPRFIYMYRLGRNGQSMDINSLQKNRAQHQRVFNSLLEFYSGLEEIPEEVLHYIERCIAQVMENQFQIYISMGNKKKIRNELKDWDKQIKEKYQSIYNATEKKSILLIRKTDYKILPISTIIYKIIKGI